MSVSNPKQLKKTESKKPENLDDATLGSDPDFQPVTLNDILDLLKSLLNEVNGIHSDLSAITTRVDSNSNEVKKLQHSTFALKEDISIVR